MTARSRPAPSLRKRHGCHETPPALARFLAERTLDLLGPIASGPSSAEEESAEGSGGILDDSRIMPAPFIALDPACGTGRLLEALALRAPAGLRRRLVLSGFEIDGAALAAARDRLAPLDVAGLALHQADFLAAEVPPADLVIANPPYVRTQVLGAARAQELARRFGLSGRVDLAHAFLAAITAALRPGGALGLLTSNRFLLTRAGAANRRVLRSCYHVLAIDDLGDTRLMDAAILPAIVLAQRAATPSDPPLAGGVPDASSRPAEHAPCGEFRRVYECDGHDAIAPAEPPPAFPDVLAALSAGRVGPVRVGPRVFHIERGELQADSARDAPWTLATPERRAWLAAVARRRAATFGEVAHIRVGVKTTADAIFLRDDWDALPADLRPEPELLRPAWTHRDAARWCAARPPAFRLLYPYAPVPGPRRPIDLGAYPRACAYLERHRPRLEAREYLRAAGRQWFEPWVPHAPTAWSGPKVVYPEIAPCPRAFLDTSGALVNGDCYWIVLRPGRDPAWLHLILAVLNSPWVVAYYDARFANRLYARRRRFLTQYVSDFPLPDPRSPIGLDILRRVASQLGPCPPDDPTLATLVEEAFGPPPLPQSPAAD